MPTVGDILDQAQEFLHDDGDIWTRAELLDWLNDGYRQLLSQSHAVVRPFQLDPPGRTAWAGTQEWEDRHGEGTWRLATHPVRSASITSTYRWEAEALDGITPSDSDTGITHLWELYHADSVDHHMRLVLTKQHERPLKVYHNDKRTVGATTRELDQLTTEWWKQQGDPVFWFPAEGDRDGTYEVYEVPSAYVQSYHLEDGPEGLPRLFTGDRAYGVESAVDGWAYAYSGSADAGGLVGLGFRFTLAHASTAGTYLSFPWEDDTDFGDGTEDADTAFTHAWEVQFDSSVTQQYLAVGAVRSVSSPDRQYLASPYSHAELSTLGVPRDWKSSADAFTIWEIIVSATQLDEEDGLSLIPSRMAKYMKFYVLSRAFSRKGRGFKPDLAQHFTAWFQIGVALLTRIGNLGSIDRNYAREEVATRSTYRLPGVQLPPEFERL